MIIPKQAPVRPRVTLPDGEGDSLLEDAVRARLEAGQWGIVELTGAAGAGKSMALCHLAQVFVSDPRLILSDRPTANDATRFRRSATEQLVVCASPWIECSHLYAQAAEWRLARWTSDDSIEYLLAVHPQQCASVMRRLQADPQRLYLAGLPGLCRAVLDQLATDVSVVDVRTALQQEISARFPSAAERSAAGLWCFDLLRNSKPADRLDDLLEKWRAFDAQACVLLGHKPVQCMLAAEYVAEELHLARHTEFLAQRCPEELVQAAADVIRDDPQIVHQLAATVLSTKRTHHPTAASLLHAITGNWRPADGRAPLLNGAYLAVARWEGIRLTKLEIRGADLTGADLREGQLHDVSARLTQFVDATLHGTQLLEFRAPKANFAGADLSHVRAPDADFQGANLQGANLEGALLKGAKLTEADLSEGNFQRADLREALLVDARLTDADFSGANLSWATLNGLPLRRANFTGAQFAHAAANGCDLEYMRLPGANFERATLRGALLTGSQMPDACFRYAQLAGAGLADIDWARADLRCADLRGCTFHLGSSRSGLVDSPIASEGSRTGFYTDEYLEQDFKAPEEIRKANLCSANLRGALLNDVDFYLVDLRGALYTDEQEAHFRRCRAILETRV